MCHIIVVWFLQVSKAARQEKKFQDYNERCTFHHQAKVGTGLRRPGPGFCIFQVSLLSRGEFPHKQLDDFYCEVAIILFLHNSLGGGAFNVKEVDQFFLCNGWNIFDEVAGVGHFKHSCWQIRKNIISLKV